jgi:hypothetical protein
MFTPHLLAACSLLLAAPAAPEGSFKTVTLKARGLPLSAGLKELTRQTGISVPDRRQTRTDPRLDLDLERASFWQALDAIAERAKAAVSLYREDAPVALVDGPFRRLPVSYSGPFRTVAKRITMTRDFETDGRYCVVQLEVAWEPTLVPFYLDQGAGSVSLPDGMGHNQTTPLAGKGPMPAHGRTFLDFSVRFPAPKTPTARLNLLRGQLTLVASLKMLTFTFPDLAEAARRGKRGQKITQDGVTVSVVKLIADEDPWEVVIRLAYPADGPQFDSYQSWLANNEIYLKRVRGGARRRPPAGGVQTERAVYPRAELRYFFEDKKPRLGRPKDWKLIYRTPGQIVQIPARFEFKNLPLW